VIRGNKGDGEETDFRLLPRDDCRLEET